MKVIRWVVDEDGYFGVELFWCLTLIKYKYSTLVRWFEKCKDAPKYVVAEKEVEAHCGNGMTCGEGICECNCCKCEPRCEA